MAADFEFMRKKPVDLMRYLPKFLSKSPTFKNTQDTLSWEHERYRLKLVDTARQFFLETATWGLSDWEKFLGITPREGASFEARKAVCRVKLRGLETMTPANTIRLMQEFFTGGAADVKELGDGELELILNNGVFYWDELFAALWEFLPAHLEWSLKFNTDLQHDIYPAIVNVEADTEEVDAANIPKLKSEINVANIIYDGTENLFEYDWQIKQQQVEVNVGNVLLLGGYEEYAAEVDDSFDYDWWKIIWDNWQKWKHDPLVKEYNHHFEDEGEIDPDEAEIFPDGEWLRIYYGFPYTKRVRYSTIYNPRKDVTSADINLLGNYAAANRVVLNGKGAATTGIVRALMITRTVEKIF